MAIGTAFHMACLQGRLFAERYYKAPESPRNTKEGKEEHRAAQEANPGKEPIKAPDYEMIQRMADALFTNRHAREILESVTAVEETLLWTCEETGALCKALVDASCGPIAADLKSCLSAKPGRFGKDLYEMGYDISAGHYTDSPFGFEEYVYIAVEKQYPHIVTVHRLPTRIYPALHEEVRGLRARWLSCKNSGEYRGYPEVIYEAEPPAWRLRELGLEG
jgi:hypothetical protein